MDYEIKNVANFVNNALNEERSLISDHAEVLRYSRQALQKGDMNFCMRAENV